MTIRPTIDDHPTYKYIDHLTYGVSQKTWEFSEELDIVFVWN